jgi:putative ABC transport system ATP-binding protein
LQEVDLEVRAGELTLLMGPSGSGKTTLLSILGCILRASEGRLEIPGQDVTSLPERELPRIRREAIGFVFQGCNLFPTLTAAENVALALDVRGMRGAAARQRGEELLEEVGLAEKSRSFPADLSGGQKQRVAIARANRD